MIYKGFGRDDGWTYYGLAESKDGEKWESLALIKSPKYDLRDAKITNTRDGHLMLNGAGMIADAKVRYYSMSWFSSDGGRTWDEGRQIGDQCY